ncbi:MAG: hypothetical protein LIO94_10910 [Clostridiales bacterium]|nr:hypothetical protein [Clostridiales bacterium]
MKKKLILGLLALSTASMLCGFDSAETAESILDKATEASSSVDGIDAGTTLNCDLAVNIGDGTTTSSIAVLVTADLDVQATLDPLATMVDGSMSISTFGQSEDLILKMYMVTGEDDSVEAYTYTEDSSSDAEGEGSWEYTSESGIDIQSLMDLSSTIDYSDMAAWGLDFTLASEAADYEGTECYLLTSVLDSSSFTTVLNKAEELVGEDVLGDISEEELSSALELLDGLKLNIEYYISTETYLPVAMHMDMNDSDLSTLNAYVATMLAGYLSDDDTSTVEIVLNDLSMDYTFSYEEISAITVPEEALEAIAAQEADDTEGETEILSDDSTETELQLVEG